MIVDFDDHSQQLNAMPWLHKLREINPRFRCTLFAVPGLGSEQFWASHPHWVELAVHGWTHNSNYECAEWSTERTLKVLDHEVIRDYFVKGFKAPGWQISDGCYAALVAAGFWVADQHLEDERRPKDLPTYFYEDGDDRWHGHVQNVCGNGIEETWVELSSRVAEATEFLFASEALSLCPDPVHS